MKKTILNKTYVKKESIIRKEKNSFSIYDNPDQYIYSDEEKNIIFNTNILNEFPEKLANWKWVITNTGLVCFYNDSTQVIYDMFDDSEIGTLENIKPDISMMLQYNFINQPLNVRKVNFKNGKFIPDLKYNYNNFWYYFLNCDGLYNNKKGTFRNINSNLYFEIGSEEIDIDKIYFDYKPIFAFKTYNSDGTPSVTNSIKINELSAELYEDNIFFIDLSSLKNGEISPEKILISVSGSGFMEVI